MDGEDTYLAGGRWQGNGQHKGASIGLVAMGGSGFTADFDYVRVYWLDTPGDAAASNGTESLVVPPVELFLPLAQGASLGADGCQRHALARIDFGDRDGSVLLTLVL